MEKEWDLLKAYLEGCAKQKRPGANVLFYGPPGCGKTEFARALLADSDLDSFELVSQSLSGDSLSQERRRSFYQQANHYLDSNQSVAIIVDEMDGILNIEDSMMLEMGRVRSLSKAAANSQLESNKIPTIWITNEPSQLDPAQLRRFDLVIRFKRPSPSVIQSILRARLGETGVSDSWIRAVAESSEITPGLVNSLASVTSAIACTKNRATNFEALLDTAIQQRGIHIDRNAQKPYDLNYCNASTPPQTLCATLRNKTNARCLLHGSTGTGKTAFAKHMARDLGLAARIVRPSTLLDPYVGGTEHNIANLFNSTMPDESLIILDEFESFASNRQGARHSWQVSMINELLGQIEDYQGRIIACTNHPNLVDPAIRRRFQLKVELLPLTEEQRISLFREFCKKLKLVDGRGFHPRKWVQDLELLAYGHIANAAEIASHHLDLTVSGFASLLRQEIEATNGPQRRPIGFSK